MRKGSQGPLVVAGPRTYSNPPLVRVELLLVESGETVEAELSREAARQLDLVAGESVFVNARKLTVFAGDYQI